jgi:hypothetical protein
MDSSREGRVDETLSVNPPIVLLKNIAAGEKAIVKLSLTNLGTQPVTISRVVPDCSCTSAILSSRHAERGQSLGLEISVLGRPDLAMTEKYITLVYEDDSSQQIPIRITNVSPASLSPASLDFGRVERSELPASRKIRLSRAAVSTPERIDMAFQDSVQGFGVTLERMDDSFIYFSVQISDAVPLGEFSTHLLLSDKGREFRRSIPVYGVVRGAYFASPSSVVLVLPYALPTSIESSTVRVVSRTSDDRQRFTIGVAEVSDSLAGWLEADLTVDGE